MATIDNKNAAFLCFKFYCNICDYGTSKKSSYKNHCESKRHNTKIFTTNNNENYANLCSSKYQCEKCDKKFKDRTGLWRHKKKCVTNDYDKETMIDGINIKDKDALVIHLLKQNSELQHKIIDMASKSTITNNTNSHIIL
jgi:hypothetical protein